jgi:hypothetical protein
MRSKRACILLKDLLQVSCQEQRIKVTFYDMSYFDVILDTYWLEGDKVSGL